LGRKRKKKRGKAALGDVFPHPRKGKKEREGKKEDGGSVLGLGSLRRKREKE